MAPNAPGHGGPRNATLASPGNLERLAAQLEEDEGPDGLDASPPHPVNLDLGFSPNSTSDPSADEIAFAAAAAAAALGNSMTEEESAQRKRKPSPPGTTTARKKKTTKSQTAIKIGCRVWVSRKTCNAVLELDAQQRECIRPHPDNCRFFGTAKSGKGAVGCNVDFDAFPAGHKTIVKVRRARLTVLKTGDEENDIPSLVKESAAKELEEMAKKKKKPTPHQIDAAAFRSRTEEEIQDATNFRCRHNEEDCVEWDILPDGDHILADPMKVPETLGLKKEIDFSDTADFGEMLFKDCFPSVQGHGKLLDEFFSDRRAPHCQTVKDEKIAFNQPDDDDPDWTVKQCHLLMVAAVTEAEIDIDNLWKRGQGGGRHPHPNFGQHIPIDMFKAFEGACALMWADKKWWCEDQRDRAWDTFVPCLNSFNGKRKALFLTQLLMMDESMSGWRPETSKGGSLPYVAWEPQKPVPLGTMLRNGVECSSGVLVFQDVVVAPEHQDKKKHCFEDLQSKNRLMSCLPTDQPIAVHAAEASRQVEGAGVPPGGWCGGDAWFGSAMSCVELKSRLDVFSTLVVKQHKALFPMEVLHSILSARHGEHPAGHWVVMTAVICSVKVIAIAHAWSQKGVAHFITSCGKTCPSKVKHASKFEDEWGNTNCKSILRPDVIHFLHECAPLIDEHNKARQSVSALEQ